MAYRHVHVDILLKPFRFWCQKVLPLVYDDSLSYYEVLCKLTKYINELIENMKLISDAFDEIQDEFDDMKEQFDAIVEYYENIENIINGFRDDLEALGSDYSDFKTWTQGQIETITTAIAQIPIITVDSELSSTSTNPVQNKVITEALQGVTPMTIDDALSTSSTNPVQNKVITQAIQGITPMTVDDALSTVSENPVQNKVITNAINAIPVITVDDAMSQSSENPVQNKVIYNALGNVAQSLGSLISALTDRVANLEHEYNVVKRLGSFNFTTQSGETGGTFVIERTVASLPNDFVVNNYVNPDYHLTFSYSIDPLSQDGQTTVLPTTITCGYKPPYGGSFPMIPVQIITRSGVQWYQFTFPYRCICPDASVKVYCNVEYAKVVN